MDCSSMLGLVPLGSRFAEGGERVNVDRRGPTSSATSIRIGPVLSGMATQSTPEETKVSDSGVVTVPASIRQRLDIEPGDKLRWNTDDEGNLTVEIVRERYGAFEDAETTTFDDDPVETHDTAGFTPSERHD
jgi:AbrB family looped-hinge helix DNA binding protein